ncbi:hypothetical protein J5N97_029090 [Dioscorea zingiberensis]|uniref:Katanin p80 WD40 repeat-containing subunit B1 homolog n=1 Tax=Dioscorea zingiberensis TaxID=325984 RepID=A0A9D5C0L5_9LILI|nr:hypothetical protein J5N97_029090 [Dioscorea zingiberensis]
MATGKRAYKLQEFVAHSSNVNCLKIGRRTSRVLVTGGEDHKVNLWAIGKPNALLSLSGHTSAVESVSFDSSEVMVAAGAASGTIKLWDLEEAKIVRDSNGSRSNCMSVDFHPFGEFFASGSLDTNHRKFGISEEKDAFIRIKGHTRGVNAIRFTPDGRWVVSGGEDNSLKLWDLTAGKLLHDFKYHEGQIQCIDFHPHEFLLATGSADKTVKFWDLETFELIGSADLRCHDTVDVGWSRLSDLNIHEGKLLGCSYNQSCVGVWVVDLSRVEPYAIANAVRLNGHSEPKSTSSNSSVRTESVVKANMGREVAQCPPKKETVSASDEDAIADLTEQHEQFINAAQSRLTKLQLTVSVGSSRLWERNDIRGVINAMEKMSDHAVSADVINVLMAKVDIITLDLCTCLLPLLTSLLESKMDRHLGVSLDMLLKLVKIFGPVIHSTLSAGPSVGVDLQAEQRLERCNLCFIELEKVKRFLPSLTRRGGSIAKTAQELKLGLQEML